MKLQHTLALILAIALLHGCGGCGGNNENSDNPDAGNNGGDMSEASYTDDDSVAGLPEAARRALCEDVIAASGEPGEEIDCGDGLTLTLPSVGDCAAGLTEEPECVTVAAYSDCSRRISSCDLTAFDDDACYFITHETCEPVDPETAVVDLTDGAKRELCEELVFANDGPADLECSTTEVRHVPGVNECIAKLDTFQPCATVGALRECFSDFAQCQEVDRDACWFLVGDDGGCSAPYLGFERIPVNLSVLPPVPANCDMPGPRQRIPFMISTTDVIPLVPGDIVNGLPVIPGLTFDAGSFAVRRPLVSKLTEKVCTSDTECGAGFKCATGGLPGAPRQCTRQSPVSFVPATIRADFDPGVREENKQLVGVLIENTSLLDGRLPTSAGSLHDENGEKDLFAEPTRATDPTRIHREAIKNFLVNLASVADPLNTAVSIFWYAGQVGAEARPLINERELEDHFTNDLSVGEALIDAMPDPVPKPANLWQAMRAMIRKDYALDKYADHEKFLFIFADGPNEVWDGTDDQDGPATYEQALADLQEHDIHVYVVQLDAEVDPTLIRDVPSYWAGNDSCQDDATCMGAPPCSGDSECANFETCRPATVYGATENDPPTQTPVSYCMPQYNDEGRLGPIDYYADLACRTGGNFMYVTEAAQMRHYWGSLASTVNGQYSIEADFAALQSSDFPDGWYRLAGVFLGMVGLRDLGEELSGPIEATDLDNRAILRMGQ